MMMTAKSESLVAEVPIMIPGSGMKQQELSVEGVRLKAKFTLFHIMKIQNNLFLAALDGFIH